SLRPHPARAGEGARAAAATAAGARPGAAAACAAAGRALDREGGHAVVAGARDPHATGAPRGEERAHRFVAGGAVDLDAAGLDRVERGRRPRPRRLVLGLLQVEPLVAAVAQPVEDRVARVARAAPVADVAMAVHADDVVAPRGEARDHAGVAVGDLPLDA